MAIANALNLRRALKETDIIPFIGVYDVFSATIAARYYKGLFLSGFSFAASYYGLPDIGFISWSDIVGFAQRVKTMLPDTYILVDIDDGYVDVEVACHVVQILESIGVSGVILEDQKRPRRCGHVDGKLLMELDPFLEKLSKVLATRQDLFVVARTDASDIDEIVTRVTAFAELKPDAILADGIKDLEVIKTLKTYVDLPIVFNQIAGGKSPASNLNQLKEAGVSLVNYSTPCLFAAQEALEEEMKRLRETDGFIQKDKVGVPECNTLLHRNLANMYVNTYSS
jgi:2-methylisocitrate lyase-like PEP mutase family enzyme